MKYLLIVLCIIPSELNAQTNYQKTNDVISWVSVVSSIAIDTYGSFQCSDKKICLIRQGIKDTSIIGSSELIKHFFPSDRPCAVTNTCGIDNPMKNMPSEHTALAFGSLPMNGQGRFQIQISLASITAIGRHEANKHTTAAILVGALLGSGIDYVTSKIN